MSTSLEEDLATAKNRALRFEYRLIQLQNQLRLQFAAEAMNGLMIGFSVDTLGKDEAKLIAKTAFLVADALLEEAKK